MSHHAIKIEGFVGRDAEMRYTPSGTAITNFSVGVNEDYKKKGTDEWQKQTIWMKVSVFGDNAEKLVNRVKKGMKISCEGVLQFDPKTGNPRTYARKDGTLATSFEMTAFHVHLADEDETQAAPDYEGDVSSIY